VHKHYRRVDGLVYNAGRSYAASVEEIDPALFDEIFHLNVLGPIVAMQAVIPLMRAQGGGSIVNINSGTVFMTVPQYSLYSSSKRAPLGFSLTARAELEKDRIVVSEIYPFITAANFGKNKMGNSAGGGPSSNYAEGDKPEFVAGLVLQVTEEGQLSISRMIVFAKWPGSRPKLKLTGISPVRRARVNDQCYGRASDPQRFANRPGNFVILEIGLTAPLAPE
jgi:short-subunit dehydrogenase